MKQPVTTAIPVGTTVDFPTLYGLRQRARWVVPALQRLPQSAPCGPRIPRARSRGMEYEESRAYMPGDDVRHIDWRVTARTGAPHTKVYHEYLGRDVIIVVDLADSMHFGTRSAFKSVVAAHAAVLLAWASVDAGDRVGAVLNTASDVLTLRPVTGASAVTNLANALVGRFDNRPASTVRGETAPDALAAALAHAGKILSKPCACIVISDLHNLDAALCTALTACARRGRVLLCWVLDPLEIEPPPPGRYPVTDGDARKVLDTHAPEVGTQMRTRFNTRIQQIRELMRGPQIQCIALCTGTDVAADLGACIEVVDARARFAPG